MTMHLFGDSKGPHLAHFQARRLPGFVELGWDVRNAPVMRWRVWRSDRDFVLTSDGPASDDQVLVLDDDSDTYVRDEEVVEGPPYFYSVFAEDESGAWQLQVKIELAINDHLHWHHPSHEDWPETDHHAEPALYVESGHFAGHTFGVGALAMSAGIGTGAGVI
jgi:hypothetical protein